MDATNKEAADNMTNHFLARNGGYITAENLSVINRLRYLGRESFTATRIGQTTVATIIINGNQLIGSCAIKTREEKADLQRDVYQAPAGMDGATMKEAVLTYKLSNMDTMNNYEAKTLAKQLGIENYSQMKKGDLYAALEAKKAEREAIALTAPKAEMKWASSETASNKGFTVGDRITFTDTKGKISSGSLTKVCPKMVEFMEDVTNRLRWANYPEIISAMTIEESVEEVVEELVEAV